jgi:hypothetical protein
MKTAQEILSDDAYSLLGLDKIISKLRNVGEDFDEKELRHAYKQLEVNQRTQRQKKPIKLLKITGPPGAYQIDLIFLPKYRSSNRGIKRVTRGDFLRSREPPPVFLSLTGV